nr:MAG: RNA-dependent RNA polymerase [Leptosphaeria biglobosa botourmiavirus 2]
MTKSLEVGARCPAAGPIRQALKRAVRLVEMDFPSGKGHRQTSFRGQNCSSLRTELSDRKAALLVGRSGREFRTLSSALKSLDRVFDVECKVCDRVAANKARAEWQRMVATPVAFDPSSPASWSEDPLGELARRVRRLVGSDWAEGIEASRQACLVPDQKGCFEVERGLGGTLAVSDKYCSRECEERHSEGDPCHIPRSSDVYGLRVGVAKTKGKFRVVTMQTATVKEVLRPVHDHLYDFLSRRKWLVRGDLTKEHIKYVLDDRIDGEDFISGDCEAATNNIYLPAVKTIIDVLSESPSLSPKERELLVGSFSPDNLHWVSSKGRARPILRGSMMGNLVSFPVLCLLNKACFDIVSSLRRKRTGARSYRRPIINGDDIAFAGDRQTFDDWAMVTAHFGLVVNKQKTGFSSRFIDLNSRTFDVEKNRFLAKPVLSCLMPGDDTSCLLTRLWEGLKVMSPGALRTAIVTMRHEIARREISLSCLPPRMRRVLLKERWFRAALLREPCLVESGTARHWKVVSKDFRPAESHFALYERAQRKLLSIGVNLARGKIVVPYKVKLGRSGSPEVAVPKARFRLRSEWCWRWTEPLLRWWERSGLPVRSLSRCAWEEDCPDLAFKIRVQLEFPGIPPPLSLLQDSVRPDGVNWI